MAHTPPSVSTGRRLSVSPVFKFLGVHISKDLSEDTQHLNPGQEDTPVSLLPEETEEGPSVSSDSREFLPLYHREHPYKLHLSMIWQLLCRRPEITAQCVHNFPTHHWFPTPHH